MEKLQSIISPDFLENKTSELLELTGASNACRKLKKVVVSKIASSWEKSKTIFLNLKPVMAYTTLTENANNKNTIILNWDDVRVVIDYRFRLLFTRFMALSLFLLGLALKRRLLGSSKLALQGYLVSSLIICRENLNPYTDAKI